MAYGTLSTLDTLAASQQTIAQYGEDNAFVAIDAARTAHNMIVNDMLVGAGLVERTTDRLRRYGGPDNMSMDEIDQWGTPDAQKVSAGSPVYFPLKLYGLSVQWTRKFMQVATTKELAEQFIAAQDADINAIIREIKRAIFYPTNYTFVDKLVDSVSLSVKALVNADSAPLPLGPNGEVFTASSHTHYLGTASFVAANLTSLITTVAEHFARGSIMVYINSAQEAAIRAFTGFVPYVDARIVQATTANVATTPLDMVNLYNRAIGIFGGAEIVIKPWVPAGYVFATIKGQPAPLAMRTRDGGGDLVIAAEDESHPLRARTLEREFGVGVWNRINGAVLDTANASYTTPTIN